MIEVTLEDDQVDVVTGAASASQTEADLVVIQSNEVDVVSVGEAGPRGAAGPASGDIELTRLATQTIGGHRVVRMSNATHADYADCSVLAQMGTVLGVTLGAAVSGDELTIKVFGEVTEPSWNWTPLLPIFLGTNGMLTQTPPVAPNFLQSMGTALSATKALIRLDEPIELT